MPLSDLDFFEAHRPRAEGCAPHWSLGRPAGQSDLSGAAVALEQFCRTWWHPIYAFIRHCLPCWLQPSLSGAHPKPPALMETIASGLDQRPGDRLGGPRLLEQITQAGGHFKW